MSNCADLPALPDRSTGWSKSAVCLSTREGKIEVPGLVKHGFGVSRGPGGDDTYRLTQLTSGCAAFYGSQGACKRLGDALHEHVPSLEKLETSDTTRIPEAELRALHHLLRLARLA